MSPQKSPAFSFYARDFLAGTSTMSLQEVGAYVRLLAYQWDAGSVPAEPDERARVMGCAKAQERELWKRIEKKFVLTDGVYLNERLEEERTKQTDRRRRLSDNGKLGGRPPKANGKQNETNSFPKPKANENLNESLAIASASAIAEKDEKTQQRQPSRGSGLIPSPAYVALRSQYCAFVGSKLEVPLGLHAELRDNHGPNAEQELQDWYASLNETAETEGWRVPRDGGIFKWLKELYAVKFPPTRVNGGKSIDEQIDEWARS